uniref:AAA+ ATPase domain-containing protein n=1 Tax=Brassica oleracea var. oleracea TaxID=109376 RepID=A0A0D3E3B9_BRAOL
MFSVCASLSGFSMLFRSMLNDFVPEQLRSYIYENVLGRLFTPSSKNLTLIIDENSKYKRNLVYEAAEMYLRTKIGPETERLRVGKTPKQKHFIVTIAKGEAIRDTFEDIQVKWLYVQTEKANSEKVKRYYELTFEKKLRERVLDSYLNHVIAESEKIKRDLRVVNLYSRDVHMSSDDDGSAGGSWGCISLEHPSTFETLAMDPSAKKKIIDDLDRFLKRKEFYKRVGKAWKRGYLLYGPPGTGKSSLIAAMANYLKFDVFDLDLSNIYDNGELKRILLSTTNRSILVIEDIDCNAEVRDREDENQETGKARGKRKRREDEYDESEDQDTQLTLSGILNFIDGLWSSFGDERIIVFTTNHKDRLDPALLRPGRMDMHINMSYCTGLAFRTLVSNYLGLDGLNHPLCEEIEKLIDSTEVTPAELAEQLMQDDDPNVILRGVISFVEKMKYEKSKGKVKAKEDVPACKELLTKKDDSCGKQSSMKNQKQAGKPKGRGMKRQKLME